MKTVAMRIRGVSEETGEAIPKLDGLIKRITGVDVMKDKNTFKSTYEIMKEISIIWKDIEDVDQANLLEKMFGKHQGAVGASLLNNMADGIKAVDTAVNSFGSSAKEQTAYMTSLQAKVNELRESTIKLWVHTIDSEFMKSVVSFGTGVVNVIDYIGLLQVAIIGAVTYLSLFKKGLLITPIISALTMAFSSMTLGINTTTASMLALNAATKLFAPLAIVASIYVLVTSFQKFTVTLEEQRQKVVDLSSAISELQSSYDLLESKSNRTEQEEKYLKILEAQISAQKTQLAYNTKLLVQREYMQSNDNSSGVLGGNISSNLSDVKYGKGKSGDINQSIADLEKYKNQILDININDKNAIKTIEELNFKIAEKTNYLTEEYNAIKENVKILEDSNEKSSEEYKLLIELADAIGKVIVNKNKLTDANKANNQEAQLSTLEELQKQTKEYVSEVDLLKKAQEELNSEGRLSQETLDELVGKYDDFAQVLGLGKDELIKFVTAKKDERNNFIQTEIEKTDATIEQVKTRLSALRYEQHEMQIMFNRQYGMYKSKIDNMVNSGAMTQSEANKRLSSMRVYDNPVLGVQDQINSTIAELDKLQGRKSYLDYVSGGLGLDSGKTTSSSTPDSQRVELSEFINLLTQAEEIQNRINDVKNKRDLLETDDQRIESIKQEIALQDELRKKNEELLQAQTLSRTKLVDNFKQISQGTELEGVITDFETLQVDLDKFNNLTPEGTQKVKAFTDSMQNLNKSIISSKNSLQDSAISIKNLQDSIQKLQETSIKSTLKSVTDSISTQMKTLQNEQKTIIDSMQDSLDNYEESQNAIIEKKQEELKLLQEQYNTEDKLLEIEKQRELIKSLKNQKNVRVFKQGEGWVWSEDIARINEETNKLKELEEQYNKENIIKAKEKEIKALEDATRKEVQRQKQEIEITKNNFETRLADYESFKTVLTDMQNDELATLAANIDSKISLLKKYEEAWRQHQQAIVNVASNVNTSSNSSSSSGYGTGYNSGTSQTSINLANDARQVLHDAGVPGFHTGLDKGKFAGNIPFDPKTETIAKLLKGEIVLTQPQFNNIIPNILKSFTPAFAGASTDNSIVIQSLTVNAPNGATFETIMKDAKRLIKIR